MPKTLVTSSIAPSRLALAVHVVLALSLAGLVAVFASWWLGVVTAACLSVVVLRWWRHQRHWTLRHALIDGASWSWQIRAVPSEAWRPVVLRVGHLGPWLIGLIIDGHWAWIWPDSCSSMSRWELRRRLLVEGQEPSLVDASHKT